MLMFINALLMSVWKLLSYTEILKDISKDLIGGYLPGNFTKIVYRLPYIDCNKIFRDICIEPCQNPVKAFRDMEQRLIMPYI